MLGTTHGWAFIWAMGLGLVEQLSAGPPSVIYKKSTGAVRRHRINYQTILSPLLLLFIFLSISLYPVPYLRSLCSDLPLPRGPVPCYLNRLGTN